MLRRGTRDGSAARPATAVLLGLGLFAVFVANGREIGAGDTVPNMLLPIAVLRGDGLALNRFADLWPIWQGAYDGDLPYFVSARGDRIRSRYPPAPGLLAVPLVAPQLLVVDRRGGPEWERQPYPAIVFISAMAKNGAALVTALTGVCLYALLRRLGCGRAALPATVITVLGSNLWMTASQSPWQHGGAALALTVALLLLARPRPGRAALAAAGTALGVMVCCRLQDAPVAVVVAVTVVAWQRRRALWFLPGPIALAVLQIGWNLREFGSLLGGYAEMTSLVLHVHRVTGVFVPLPVGGIAGTLLSPSRGLLVFSPWVAVALAALPATWPRLRPFPALRAAVVALVPFLALVASISAWWAGWVFGPRYWTEVMPIFGVLLGLALAWAAERARPLLVAACAAGAIAIAIQALGAFTFPSTWNGAPVNVNIAPERLWDWRDSEITRALAEGPRPWTARQAWRQVTLAPPE